jgi:molybdenum-dependent DNA-binding transcriptional regulator ModE
MKKKCELCDRVVEKLYKHHLVPKQRGGKKGPIAKLCWSCKDMVHLLFTNKELEREYNTIELLLSTDKIQKYVKWIKKQKSERVTMAIKKRRR